MAAGDTQRVMSPRQTNARSEAAQFWTWDCVLCVGWTLDFIHPVWSAPSHPHSGVVHQRHDEPADRVVPVGEVVPRGAVEIDGKTTVKLLESVIWVGAGRVRSTAPVTEQSANHRHLRNRAVAEQPQRLVAAILGADVDDLQIASFVRRRLPGQTHFSELARLEDMRSCNSSKRRWDS